MPSGPQTRTSPNTDNLVGGASGILSIATWTGASIGSYTDVGNCPRFDYEMNETPLEHTTDRTKTKMLDKEIVLQNGITVTFTLDEITVGNMRMFLASALSGTRILYAGQDTGVRYALRFVSDNAAGPNYQLDFWKVKLTPNGPFSLIGREWSTLNFTGKCLADIAGHATSPLMTMTYDTTTSSTTTTKP